MYVYICIYICMYVHIYIYIHMCIRWCMCTSIYLSIYVYMYIYIHIYKVEIRSQPCCPSRTPTPMPRRRTAAWDRREGLVIKAHRLLYHSTPGSKVIKKEQKEGIESRLELAVFRYPRFVLAVNNSNARLKLRLVMYALRASKQRRYRNSMSTYSTVVCANAALYTSDILRGFIYVRYLSGVGTGFRWGVFEGLSASGRASLRRARLS